MSDCLFVEYKQKHFPSPQFIQCTACRVDKMKIYIFLLICTQFLCIHSLLLRKMGRHGVRRIDSFIRPVQLARLGQRNLRVQRIYAPPRTLAFSFGNYDFMCQLCLQTFPYVFCSLYCSQPHIRQPSYLGYVNYRLTN